MRTVETGLPEVVVYESQVFSDLRGEFLEAWRDEFDPALRFVQDNVSVSGAGVLRGLHYQWPEPQGKLVRCLSGRIFDVAVDVRAGSPWFGKWTGVELDLAGGKALFVPEGFAHGFCVLEGPATVTYKCTAGYRKEFDAGVAWDDPEIGIAWPVGEPILSDKDANLPCLRAVGAALLPAYPGG